MTTTLDHAELRRLALAATPGPWEKVDDGSLVVGGPRRIHVAQTRQVDAAFIAAADPTVVLALLDKSEADERVKNGLEHTVKTLLADNATLTESLTDARREGNIARDTLRDEVEVRKAAEAERDRLLAAIDAVRGHCNAGSYFERRILASIDAALNPAPEREDKT